MPIRGIDPTNLSGLERTIERCQVTSIPAGSPPKFIKCKLPGGDGPIVDAWWSGFPSLAVNDYVALRRTGGGYAAQYVVAGASGETAAAGAAHDILSATHSDTTPAAVANGDMVRGSSAGTPKWEKFTVGSASQFLGVQVGPPNIPAWKDLPAASQTTAGVAEIATQTEVNTGTDDARIVTPLKLLTAVHRNPGRDNPVINGAFQIWQRGTSFTSVANGAYTADRFVYGKVGTMVHDISRSTDVPTVAEAGVLIPYSVLIDCTTADAAIAATDLCIFRTTMEGYNWSDLAQRQFTVSFWTAHTKTGTYCAAFGNSGGDRTYIGEYTQNVADTWEYKTITVSASPSAGTWDYTTGAGLVISWALAAGSNFHTTADAWQTGNYLSTSNQVNATDSTSNNFRLALVNIVPGAVAALPRLPDKEIEYGRCLRYYQKSYDYATAPGSAVTGGAFALREPVGIAASTAGTIWMHQYFMVPMRAAPTIVIYSTGTGTANAVRNASAGNDRTGVTTVSGEKGLSRLIVDNTSANAIGANAVIQCQFTADAEF